MHFPTFEAKYIGFKLLFTVDPANVEYILKTNFSIYVKGPAAYEIQYDLLGDGIFNTDGEMWKLQRKSASLEFSFKMLRDYSADAFRKYALKLAMILQGQLAHNNNVANMQDMFMRMTFDSICEVGFGVEIGSLASSLLDVPFSSAFDRSNALCDSRYFDPFWKLKKRFNLGSEAKLKQDVRVLDNFTYGIIQKRRNLLNAHQDEEIGAPRQLDAVINLMQSILSQSIDAVINLMQSISTLHSYILQARLLSLQFIHCLTLSFLLQYLMVWQFRHDQASWITAIK